jgi:hypothetical protein
MQAPSSLAQPISNVCELMRSHMYHTKAPQVSALHTLLKAVSSSNDWIGNIMRPERASWVGTHNRPALGTCWNVFVHILQAQHTHTLST